MHNEGLRGLVNGASSLDSGFPVLAEAKRLALVHTPYERRKIVETLLLFDAQLANIALSQGEPMLKQIKLAWWREETSREPEAGAMAGQPLAARIVKANEWSAKSKKSLVDAWEQVATEQVSARNAAQTLGEARAMAFCEVTGQTSSPAIKAASNLWAQFDLSSASFAVAPAVPNDEFDIPMRLPKALRTLAILAGLSRRALRYGYSDLLAGRTAPLAALRLGIIGR